MVLRTEARASLTLYLWATLSPSFILHNSPISCIIIRCVLQMRADEGIRAKKG